MRKILNLTATVSIFSLGSYLYVWHRTNKNLDQYNKILEAGATKDASRLSNESFGISWGFQADDIVMNKIDSGDYLLIKFQCEECLRVEDYVRCMTRTALKLEEEWDTVGYAYRNSEGLWILYNQFGVTKIKNYAELVSLPYLKGLTIQKCTNTKTNYHKKLRQLLQKQGKVQPINLDQSAVQMANRINKLFYGNQAISVGDIRELVQTQHQILVRTETNRTLRSL